MAPAFWVSLPITEAITSVLNLRFLTVGYSHKIAVAYCSVVRIVLGGMLLLVTVSLFTMTEVFRNGGDRLLGVPSPFLVLAPFAIHSIVRGHRYRSENKQSVTIYLLLSDPLPSASDAWSSILGYVRAHSSTRSDHRQAEVDNIL